MADLNYYGTFIAVADDCPVSRAEVPQPRGGRRTVPVLQYEMLAGNPYQHTQEDVLFETHADHKGIPAAKRRLERERFLAQDQACLRASALGKRYGWGIHFDTEGRAAIYAMESPEYARLASDTSLTHLKAMRSRRA